MKAKGRFTEAVNNLKSWKNKNKYPKFNIESEVRYARKNPKGFFDVMFRQLSEGIRKMTGPIEYGNTDTGTLFVTAETGGFLSTTVDRFNVVLEDEYGQKNIKTIDTGFLAGYNIEFYILQAGDYTIYVNGYSKNGNSVYSMKFQKYLMNSGATFCTVFFKDKTVQFLQ